MAPAKPARHFVVKIVDMVADKDAVFYSAQILSAVVAVANQKPAAGLGEGEKRASNQESRKLIKEALSLVLEIFVDALHQTPVGLLDFAIVVALFFGNLYVLLLLLVRKLLDSGILHFLIPPKTYDSIRST